MIVRIVLLVTSLAWLAQAQVSTELAHADRTFPSDSVCEHWLMTRQKVLTDTLRPAPAVVTREVRELIAKALSDDDASVRGAAARAAARVLADFDPIATLLGDAAVEARSGAIMAAAEHPSPRATAALIEVVRTTTAQRERTLGALALGVRAHSSRRTEGERVMAVSFLEKLASNADQATTTRTAAVLALGLAARESSRKVVQRISSDPAEAIGLRAAALRAEAACGALDHKGWTAFLNGKDDRMAQAAAAACGASSERAMVAPLFDRLGMRPAGGLARAVIAALSRHEDCMVDLALLHIFEKNAQDRAPWAADALSRRPDGPTRKKFVTKLADAVAAEKNPNRLAPYVVVLARSGDRSQIDELRALLRRSPPLVRGHAAIALAILGDADSSAAIADLALDRGEQSMRNSACLALGLLASEAQAGRLASLIGEEPTPMAVRMGAARGLSFAKTLKTETVAELMHSENPEARVAALFVLGRRFGARADMPGWSAYPPETASAFPETGLREILVLMN